MNIYGGFSDKVVKRLDEVLSQAKEGSIFLDIGANDGEITQFINEEICKRLRDYTYYAFEPDIRFEASYWHRLAKFRNVQRVYKAVGSFTGKAPFHLSSGQQTDKEGRVICTFNCSSSLLKPTRDLLSRYPGMQFTETKEIRIVTLDDFAAENKIDSIHLIWADIQGAELDMIRGGMEILKKTSYLYTEYQREEMYAGCGIGLEAILALLPEWEVVEDFGSDVLLKNTEMKVEVCEL